MLIPIKAFSAAKGRLEPVLTPAERHRLARWTAARVVAAAGHLPVYVACDSADVADWSVDHGATVVWGEGHGLNGAVDQAVVELGRLGHAHVIVVHSDLALPRPLYGFAHEHSITLVPDRRLDGTNLWSFPIGVHHHPALLASYGAGSFRRHLLAAYATGLPVDVIRDRHMALDIDHPTDLLHPLVKDVLPTWLPTNPVNPLSC